MGYLLAERQRPLRVCWLNNDRRTIDDSLELIERELEKVHAFEMVEISHIGSKHFQPCDLLILVAYHLEGQALVRWVQGVAAKMTSHIWTPALIIGELGMFDSRQLVEFSLQSNWYFDVLNVEHISSLSLRIANLIRIHDHLYELKRYESKVGDLEIRVGALGKKVQSLMAT